VTSTLPARRALAAYFAAGQTTAMAAWAAGTALVATFAAKGDYAKARAALRAR